MGTKGGIAERLENGGNELRRALRLLELLEVAAENINTSFDLLGITEMIRAAAGQALDDFDALAPFDARRKAELSALFERWEIQDAEKRRAFDEIRAETKPHDAAVTAIVKRKVTLANKRARRKTKRAA